jgi:hypothetical protein
MRRSQATLYGVLNGAGVNGHAVPNYAAQGFIRDLLVKDLIVLQANARKYDHKAPRLAREWIYIAPDPYYIGRAPLPDRGVLFQGLTLPPVTVVRT